MYVNRRDVFRLAAAFIPLQAWAFASKDFWEAKPAKDWNAEEIDQMITKSPWARPASVKFTGERGGIGGNRGTGRISLPGGIGFPGGGGGGYPGGSGGGRRGGGPMGSPGAGGTPRFEATVRWESAQPIQEALHVGVSKEASDPDFQKFYVIKVIGDAPGLGEGRRRRNSNEDDRDDDRDRDAEQERREEMFKQYTFLERKTGPSLRLEKTAQGSRVGSTGPGTLFYFSKEDPVSPDDREITFKTKMGPMEIQAKFTPKDMKYLGKFAI